ncbi:MAG: hypothetical protein PHQ23_16205, partial [Candidatus Wallbacteria bacterium]|nr:hypothetical protein [Candidatus Wallbacteria bacterium]
DNEQVIEKVVCDNSEHFFGPASFFLPKKLIRTRDGFGTLPDGFAVDLASRTWYLVEAELGHHSVWNHIAPQIAKQLVAVSTPESKQILEDLVIQFFHESDEVNEKFKEENILDIDVRRVIGDILKKPPIIGIPIDRITPDLKEWAETLRCVAKLWIVKKYVEFGNPENVAYDIPEEFRPALDTEEEKAGSRTGQAFYDVTLSDLIQAGLLAAGGKMVMKYRPRGGRIKKYTATVTGDGELIVLGRKFRSPSYAAVFSIQNAGSQRQTANGWKSWKTGKGATLLELRDKYLMEQETTKDKRDVTLIPHASRNKGKRHQR